MKKNALILFYLIAITILLSACGPQYSTTYSYIRPATGQGQSCAFQCENSRLQCRQNEELKYENCQSKNHTRQLSYDLCVEKNGKKKCSYPTTSFCNKAYKQCKAAYNQCYTTCGGKVNSKTECVANCDKIKK